MRLTAEGVVSYAGLEKAALWAQAKRLFAQTEETVPKRFLSFVPLFPAELIQSMSYVGAGKGGGRAMVSRGGFSTDPSEYHQKLYQECPSLYAGDNYRRNFDYEGRFVGRGVVTVDHAWAERFPQYEPFLGERLAVRLIGEGAQAVAVPQSVYPRGCGVLRAAEQKLGVTARCQDYAAYARERVQAGEPFDAPRFEREYMARDGLLPVAIRQAEIGRVLQDLSILKSVKDEQGAGGLFTENARRAGHTPQYTPYLVACDMFEPAPVTRATARLLQLYDGDWLGDFWLPYQDASVYIDKRTMTLDVAALCEGFQLPPAYDAQTRGGRYPALARVAVVRDRDVGMLVANALNNPAYGGGMSPTGTINRLVLLPDSRELVRLGKLMLESTPLQCVRLTVPPRDYRRMLGTATLQERKGALADAMYRRESVLPQLCGDPAAHQRVKQLLDQRVERLEALTRRSGDARECAQWSGYDADVDYLRRMRRSREAKQEDERGTATPFAPDALREASIEGGYAMRGHCARFGYEELALKGKGEAEE